MESKPNDITANPLDRLKARLTWLILFCAIFAAGLIPWMRNRSHLRSFFDYGVVMGGVGRIETGQKPYVDFVTPIQTGWYVWNWAAEKLAGGTFQSMTWSAAACTLLAALALFGMLSRRWPRIPAAVVTAALVSATVAQHTIYWYNPWGVVLLAVVAWAGAVAPVFRRRHVFWHVLMAIALFLGGINKINIHLMALAIAWAWACRAGLKKEAGWLRTSLTMLVYAVCGLVLPIGAEMAWTGASPATWWHNVVAIVAGDRGSMLLTAMAREFYLQPPNNHYGKLLLQQVGLLGTVLTVLTIGVIYWRTWRRAGWLERILPALCGVIAFSGGVVLLTTNIDIAYIGLAGWMSLLIAMWLGYAMPTRGPLFYGVIVLPAALVGTVSWMSAWKGQRSQFGYANDPRSAYLDAGKAGPDLSYLNGTFVPPRVFNSLKAVDQWRAKLPQVRQQSILFGPGAEWAAHIWPAVRTPRLPLYISGGFAFGPREHAALKNAIYGQEYPNILVSKVLDIWKPALKQMLDLQYGRYDLGIFLRYSLPTDGRVSDSPCVFRDSCGGNTDSRDLYTTSAEFLPLGDGQFFVGTTSDPANMRLIKPTNRLRGSVIVQRLDDSYDGPLWADFGIYAHPNPTTSYERWKKRVMLPAGQNEIMVDYAIDSSHMSTLFNVYIPTALRGKVAAGWRGPIISQAGEDGPRAPRWLYHAWSAVETLDHNAIKSLFPAGWLPSLVLIRGGEVTPDGVSLYPGGEIWIRVTGIVTRYAGYVSVSGNSEMVSQPMVRGMWVKDARMETLSINPVSRTNLQAEFYGWCGEPGGWLVIAIEPSPPAPPVMVHITKLEHED